jgi:uncharacterized protein YegP (UPF0339 family)
MYFKIVKTKGVRQWHARIYGNNHEIVFWTQNYTSKEPARRACEMVKREAVIATIPENSEKMELGSRVRTT